MSEKEKLIDILQDNNIRISTKGNICLNDFVDNIIESKNSKLYIKKLEYNTMRIRDNMYISPDDCIDILKNTNRKKCKDIYTRIQFNDGDTSSIIDVENKIFKVEGHKFLSFFIDKGNGDWDVWVKGSEVAIFLDYSNPSEAINDHVDEENMIIFLKFIELFPISKKLVPKNMDKKTILINIPGFLNLIHSSKKPFAKKIRFWLDNEVVPALIKYGTYMMQPKELHIEFFYDKVAISDFFNKAVLYIAYVFYVSFYFLVLNY